MPLCSRRSTTKDSLPPVLRTSWKKRYALTSWQDWAPNLIIDTSEWWRWCWGTILSLLWWKSWTVATQGQNDRASPIWMTLGCTERPRRSCYFSFERQVTFLRTRLGQLSFTYLHSKEVQNAFGGAENCIRRKFYRFGFGTYWVLKTPISDTRTRSTFLLLRFLSCMRLYSYGARDNNWSCTAGGFQR